MRLVFKVSAIHDRSGQATHVELTPDAADQETMDVLGGGVVVSKLGLVIQDPKRADEVHRLDQRYMITIEGI